MANSSSGSKFGDDLKAVRKAMMKVARVYRQGELAEEAYRLYERFRPDIPAGKKGWGAKGDLDLVLVEGLGKERSWRQAQDTGPKEKKGVL